MHQDVVGARDPGKSLGRAVALATAADAVLADQLASRLGFIDQLFASDGEQNLKGTAKAETAEPAFPGGFIYAGDSKADLAVWAARRRHRPRQGAPIGPRRRAGAGTADAGIVGVGPMVNPRLKVKKP